MKCPRCLLSNPPTAQICECGYKFKYPQSVQEVRDESDDRLIDRGMIRIIGVTIIIIGLVFSLFFTFLYETSIPMPREIKELAGDNYPIPSTERVENMGRLYNRLAGILGGLGWSILGGIILLYGKERY